MTTKAGFFGLLTGLAATMILVYPLAIARHVTPTYCDWFAFAVAIVITVGGGVLAGTRSGSVQPLRCAVLGALAGGLAGFIVFCLLGAGLAVSAPQRVESIAAMVQQTQRTFLVLFLGGIVLGSFGGWLACPRQGGLKDVFDKTEPQMAMNVAITTVPASIVSGALSVFVFSRLGDSLGESSILDMPLAVSLLLILLSQLALTLILPHEAREAEYICGMNEVKMAAFVGIGAAPFLILLLSLVEAKLLFKPLIVAALLASAIMSLRSLQVLVKVILPGRVFLPAPQDGRQRLEAMLFGSIADSHGTRLIALCIGCGLVMILPLHVTVISMLINLTVFFGQSTPLDVILTQALASIGAAGASILILTAIYLFYLNLGLWFKKRFSPPTP